MIKKCSFERLIDRTFPFANHGDLVAAIDFSILPFLLDFIFDVIEVNRLEDATMVCACDPSDMLSTPLIHAMSGLADNHISWVHEIISANCGLKFYISQFLSSF